jgi:hypothetical protein
MAASVAGISGPRSRQAETHHQRGAGDRIIDRGDDRTFCFLAELTPVPGALGSLGGIDNFPRRMTNVLHAIVPECARTEDTEQRDQKGHDPKSVKQMGR